MVLNHFPHPGCLTQCSLRRGEDQELLADTLVRVRTSSPELEQTAGETRVVPLNARGPALQALAVPSFPPPFCLSLCLFVLPLSFLGLFLSSSLSSIPFLVLKPSP